MATLSMLGFAAAKLGIKFFLCGFPPNTRIELSHEFRILPGANMMVTWEDGNQTNSKGGLHRRN